MAKPRVFVSSTFYDLKHIRNDLERFIKEMGYEAILNERGHIPYGKEKKLEEYCYKEIAISDILVSILGGRFGSSSLRNNNSITQNELRKALEEGKQVYIFIDKNVYNEYYIWSKNKEVEDFKLTYADDRKVFEFIEEVYNLPRNNTIFSFESSGDIIKYLKEQWAGLFQQFLTEAKKKEEANLAKDLKSQIETLEKLTRYLKEENKSNGEAINKILFLNNPLLKKIKKILEIKYNIIFENLTELNNLLEANNFLKVSKDQWDSPEYMEWTERHWLDNSECNILKIKKDLFDNKGNLKPSILENWKEEYVSYKEIVSTSLSLETDDDFPF